MMATYILDSDEITKEFIKSIRRTFKNNPVKITVTPMDETEYLMSSKANHKHLLRAIDNIENNRNLIEVPFEEILKAANEDY
jgi:antitoxin YefM